MTRRSTRALGLATIAPSARLPNSFSPLSILPLDRATLRPSSPPRLLHFWPVTPNSFSAAHDLLVGLGAPRRLLRHIELVHEAADVLLRKLAALSVPIRADFVRVGVALHDSFTLRNSTRQEVSMNRTVKLSCSARGSRRSWLGSACPTRAGRPWTSRSKSLSSRLPINSGRAFAILASRSGASTLSLPLSARLAGMSSSSLTAVLRARRRRTGRGEYHGRGPCLLLGFDGLIGPQVKPQSLARSPGRL
jgi:hypothetical protein